MIELVFDADCPHVEAARAQLTHALREIGLAIGWTEWCSDDPRLPAHAHGLGSPTILVDGRDVAARTYEADGGPCCRVYMGTDGSLSGVPPVSVITEALCRRT